MTKDQWNKEFSSNLSSMLFEANMSQKELAEASGLSEAAVSQYLTGQRTPDLRAINNIAYALDCDIDDIANFDDVIE